MKDFFTTSPIEYFSREQINAVKGLLILSVMIGHIRSLAGENLEIFQFVYNFHVVAFLLLPFIYPIKQVSKAQIITWAFRFFVPFTVFFIAYGVLNMLFLNANFGFVDVMRGYFIATPLLIDRVTGSEILWFLPHIFLVFVLFNLVMTRAKNFYGVVGISLVLHVLAGFIVKDYASYIPFTASNIAYLFFIGIALRFIILNVKDNGKKYAGLFFALFIALQFISIATGSVLGYTGIYLFDILSLPQLILCDALVLSAMLFFLYSEFFSKVRILNWLGQHSIIIFLVHQPFLFLTWKVLENFGGQVEAMPAMVLYGVVSFVVSLICSSLCVLFFLRFNSLNLLVFPKSIESWRQIIVKN